MALRLGIVLDDETALRAGREGDPVDVVVVRSTFLNPPRAAAMRRARERIRERFPDAELVPYAWHYLTHERADGVAVGSNRGLGDVTGDVGHFRATPAVEHAWEVTRLCAEALDARKVVVRTPASFSPGTLSRRRLTRFVESREPGEPTLIWEPRGLWEPAGAAAFGATIGVEVLGPVFSMTGNPLEFGECRWLAVSGGKDARLRSSQAEILAYSLAPKLEAKLDSDTEHVTVLFEGPRALANLRSFVDALQML